MFEEVLLWVKRYQTEPHATEKSAVINIDARPSITKKIRVAES
jgi:hypothetical protein